MSDSDWFRNKSWDHAIEASFQKRLQRAKRKSQYLRIQASYLSKSHPRVALDFLEQYFALGEDFDIAQAHADKARAELALGDVQAALNSYESAMAREEAFPRLQTQAYLDYTCLVLETGKEELYLRALGVLESNWDRLMFPVDRYRANGARALLFQHFGRAEEARAAAKLAVAAANETQSGFQYHQKVGLVTTTDDKFGRRVAEIAN